MEQLFINILKTSFYGSLFIFIGFFVNYIFKDKFKAKWHYCIWVIIILRFMFPVFFEIKNTSINKPIYNTVTTVEKIIDKLPVTVPLQVLKDTETLNELAKIQQTNEIIIEIPVVKTKEIIRKPTNILMSNIWFSISALILLINTLKYFSYKNCIMKTKENISEQQNNLKKSIMNELKINKNVTVFKSDKAVVPFVIGIFNPKIFISKACFSEKELKFILEHELIHIKRKDIFIKFITLIVKSIYWFNPFLYFASKKLDYFCEISCDDFVLKNKTNDEKVEYGLTLINVMKQSFYENNNLILSLSNNKKNIYKRIENMVSEKKYKKTLFYIVPIVLFIIFMSACTSIKVKESQIEDKIVKPLITMEAKENLNNKTILITGSTSDNIKDTIMLAKVDTQNKKIKLLSISRDTYIEFSAEEFLDLKEINESIPESMKINSFAYYLGGYDEINLLKEKVSQILNIKIDYYLDLNTKVFRDLVDDLGGVEVVVPEGGFYYVDPIQDLTIDLKEGKQILDGDKSEQFVRFRKTYTEGDLKRIEVQKYFLKQVFIKILENKSESTKINLILNNIVNKTKTNISLEDLLSYYSLISDFSSEDLEFYNLPISKIDNFKGTNYIFIEKLDIENFIKNEF